jgi:hypothetical protein
MFIDKVGVDQGFNKGGTAEDKKVVTRLLFQIGDLLDVAIVDNC